METVSAKLLSTEDKYFIEMSEIDVSIPISDDNANNVKSAFNKLIQRLKQGEFSIELEESDAGLFYHVANEYIVQLNVELAEVHKEMEQYGFTADVIVDS
ncbi:hypothetical protein [Thalassotalea sp. ND16A]|uniref:hypothetical protein n=1 Tax=Thalassotalea sp. ND16A TaxID=1535422 RepID=UPI00051A4C58|nr:hypothetical protein [Thalassotalea sp. ND16A]KGJ92080.1 hypothetical protein ND16A_1774 [Thalassotalea sp. ND16A]